MLHYTFTRLFKLANRCIEKLVDDENSRIYTKMLDTLDAQESELFDLKEFIEDKKTKANENCAKNKGETEEGKGTTFIICLPFDGKAVAAHAGV